MARLSVSREAKRDLIEIFVYIARDSVDAARRMNSRLEETLRTIATQPTIGRARDELSSGIRSLAVGKYVIYYSGIESRIRILRIVHGARDIAQLFQ